MNRLLIYIFIITTNCSAIKVLAQEDSLAIKVDEAITQQPINTDSIKSKRGEVFIGVDFFKPIMSTFTSKQGGEAMISYHLKNKWNIAAEVGYDKNSFKDLDWIVNANGIYLKSGFNWFITQDQLNGFYTGARLAYANYTQEVKQFPVRDSNNQIDEYGSLPAAKVSAYWLEIVLGGRVQLWKKFYGEFSVRPAIYLGAKEQDGLKPLVIPGYGKDQGAINFTVFWGLSYQLF